MREARSILSLAARDWRSRSAVDNGRSDLDGVFVVVCEVLFLFLGFV